MQYKDFKDSLKILGFISVDDFINYTKISSHNILKWEEEDKVPYHISLILNLLKGDKKLPISSKLDLLTEECTSLVKQLDDESSLPYKLEEMFLLQKKLNDSTNGKNWELGVNKFNKDINWLRCIHMEVAELIDSAPWKHWKNINSDPDMNNVQIELVDIWHFLMSYILKETNVPKAVSLVSSHCRYDVVDIVDVKKMIKESEKLSYITLAIETDNMSVLSGIEKLIEQFFICCKVSGLSFTWLQKLYIGKNCLNKFRQDNGYKEGSYIKEWDGIEDNIIMMEIIEEMEDVNFDVLYEALTKHYAKLK